MKRCELCQEHYALYSFDTYYFGQGPETTTINLCAQCDTAITATDPMLVALAVARHVVPKGIPGRGQEIQVVVSKLTPVAASIKSTMIVESRCVIA